MCVYIYIDDNKTHREKIDGKYTLILFTRI